MSAPLRIRVAGVGSGRRVTDLLAEVRASRRREPHEFSMSLEQELVLIHRTMDVLFREFEYCIHDGDASGASILHRELWQLGKVARAKRERIDAGKAAA